MNYDVDGIKNVQTHFNQLGVRLYGEKWTARFFELVQDGKAPKRERVTLDGFTGLSAIETLLIEAIKQGVTPKSTGMREYTRLLCLYSSHMGSIRDEQEYLTRQKEHKLAKAKLKKGATP